MAEAACFAAEGSVDSHVGIFRRSSNARSPQFAGDARSSRARPIAVLLTATAVVVSSARRSTSLPEQFSRAVMSRLATVARLHLYEIEGHVRLEVIGISLRQLLERSFTATVAGGVHDVRWF